MIKRLTEWMFFDEFDKKHRKIMWNNFALFLWRFRVVPLITSPILYPIMYIRRHNITGRLKASFKASENLSAWLARNDFYEVPQGFTKQAEIYNNNPLYYKEPSEVEEIVYNEFRESLMSVQTTTGIHKDITFGTDVTINYATRAELLNLLEGENPGNSDYSSTLKSMAKMNNCEPEEMLERIQKDKTKLKFMVYTITINYKYYKHIKMLATFSMFMLAITTLIILVFVMLMQN